jgi:hypothetical protein
MMTMTTLETRETTQPPDRAKLNGGIVQVTGNTRGSARRSVAAWPGGWAGWGGAMGWRDGVAGVVRFLFAGGRSPIIGRVWALDVRAEM